MYVKDINCPKLNQSESILIDGIITLEEASTVLKKMSNNKSPGSSGFSAEFYKLF
jgi:hypothetical protein